MKGSQRLAAELTIKDGLVVWDLNGLTREDWDKLGKYETQGDARWDGTLGAGGRRRK
jgi:dihydroorotase